MPWGRQVRLMMPRTQRCVALQLELAKPIENGLCQRAYASFYLVWPAALLHALSLR